MMRKSKFLMFLLCFCGVFAQISDEKNLLDSTFLQYWNRTLAITEVERLIKVTLTIYGEEKQKTLPPADDLETLQLPEISITYNDSAGFEIFQSNFENFPDNSNFIIPSSFFNYIIPEANAQFKDGETSIAAEYILINILETLYSSKMTEETDEFADETAVNRQNFDKTPYFYAILVLFVVFLFVIVMKKKKSKSENRSYLFNGMSKNDFFGGGFDKI